MSTVGKVVLVSIILGWLAFAIYLVLHRHEFVREIASQVAA